AALPGRADGRARRGGARRARRRLRRAAARDLADPRAGGPRRLLRRDRERRGGERRQALARGFPPRARAAARAAPGPRTPRLPRGRGLAAGPRGRAARRHALPGGHQLVSRGGARRGRPDRELAGGGRVEPTRGAVLGGRPGTRLAAGAESERVPFCGSWVRRAAAREAGAATPKALGAVCVRRTVDT